MCGEERYSLFFWLAPRTVIKGSREWRHFSKSCFHSLPVYSSLYIPPCSLPQFCTQNCPWRQQKYFSYLLLLPVLPNVQLHHKHWNTIIKLTAFFPQAVPCSYSSLSSHPCSSHSNCFQDLVLYGFASPFPLMSMKAGVTTQPFTKTGWSSVLPQHLSQKF